MLNFIENFQLTYNYIIFLLLCLLTLSQCRISATPPFKLMAYIWLLLIETHVYINANYCPFNVFYVFMILWMTNLYCINALTSFVST